MNEAFNMPMIMAWNQQLIMVMSQKINLASMIHLK